MRVNVRNREPPGWLAVLVVASPLLYGVYHAVTNWPTGAVALALIVAVYITAGLMLTYKGGLP